MISTDDHHELVLVLCRTTIDWMLILKVYVYNFNEFTGETAISKFGVVIHCDAMLCIHSNGIIHCDIIMDVPSNVVTHCCATMGHP